MTKKGKTPKLPQYHVTIESTGLEFNIGESISPKWEDLYSVLRGLWKLEYPAIVPGTYDYDILVTMSQEQAHTLVPTIIRRLDSMFSLGQFKPEDEDRIRVAAYIMSWWWHIRGGGPRPRTIKRGRKAPKIELKPVDPWIPELACPFCNLPYIPPKRYKLPSAIGKHWHGWLSKHFSEYHKWE